METLIQIGWGCLAVLALFWLVAASFARFRWWVLGKADRGFELAQRWRMVHRSRRTARRRWKELSR